MLSLNSAIATQSRQIQIAGAKRGKMKSSKVVLLLVVWKGVVRFLSRFQQQSDSKITFDTRALQWMVQSNPLSEVIIFQILQWEKHQERIVIPW